MTYTSTNTNKRGQSSFIKSRRSFILENLLGALHSAGVLGGGLKADLDDICGGLKGHDYDERDEEETKNIDY